MGCCSLETTCIYGALTKRNCFACILLFNMKKTLDLPFHWTEHYPISMTEWGTDLGKWNNDDWIGEIVIISPGIGQLN